MHTYHDRQLALIYNVILSLDAYIFNTEELLSFVHYYIMYFSIDSMPSTEQRRLILVTGANKGIGFEVVKKLAAESSSNGTVILLGSRDLQRGQDALIQLKSPSNVHILQLDTSSRESILRAIEEIKQKYGG